MPQEVIAVFLRDLAVEGEDFLPEYLRRSTVLGRPVAFWQNGVRYEGVATDIDGEGALLVKMGEETARLPGGEITLRTL
jgi:BirA family biotin operon repressor/biotin-[acetyl-CoA-carboxylase] ligase